MSIAFRAALAAVVLVSVSAYVRADDKDEIKQSGAAFANALNKGDAKEAKKHVLSDPDTEKFIDAMVPLSAARTKLIDASVAKFGEQGRTIAGGPRAGQAPQYTAKDFDDAQIDVHGDTATVTSKSGGKPVNFKKEGGTWKINLTDAIPHEQLDRVVQIMPKMAIAMNDTAGEIKDGKYQTVVEARRGLGQHMAAVMGFPGGPADGPPSRQR
jgi:hypothetical protein